MSIFVVSGSNTPATTQVVMGDFINTNGEYKTVNIDVTTIQDPSKKAVYDAFFNLVGSNVTVEVINSPHQGSFNHVTPNAVALEAVVLDYSTMNAGDKSVVDNAFALLTATAEAEENSPE
jgi:hypothetical protein